MQPEDRIREIIESEGILFDRHRLAIMLYLSIKGRARFKEISEGLGLSPGNLAHHLKMLEERNYVRVDKVWRDLRARVVSLTPEGVAALSSLLSRLRRL
ncbi:MAG TPA: ArsR family transcriptional regulator [Aigarchaeota archaeon]|nr:ArsR family transcriptional regulator [Aigarchaeota archaeon]